MRYPRTLVSTLAALSLGMWSCQSTPYFEGDGPVVNGLTPAFENGNLGGTVVKERYDTLAAIEEPTDEQVQELEGLRDDFVVAIDGDFAACADDDAVPLVVFGSRTAEVVERTVQRLLVFSPPGPVAGRHPKKYENHTEALMNTF